MRTSLKRMACIVSGGLAMLCSTEAQAQPTWRLVEDLRLGGSASGPNSFSNVRGLAVARNGNIFVADLSPVQIKLFSPSGVFLRNVGREGDGPGEYRNVEGLFVDRDGNIQAIDAKDSRVIVYTPAGDVVRTTTVGFGGYGFTWSGGLATDGDLLEPLSVETGGRTPTGELIRVQRLRRIKPSGALGDTLPFPGCQLRAPPAVSYFRFVSGTSSMNVTVPYLAQPQTVFAPDGTAWCAPKDEYAIYHFRVGRPETLHVVRQSVPPAVVPAAVRDSAIKSYRTMIARSSSSNFDPDAIPKVHPVIATIRADDANRLWVRRVAVTPRAAMAFDLYDPRGKPLATVQTTLRWTGIPLVAGDHAYGVVIDDDDVQHVVRARIVR
jgi:hypothetical protein